MYYLIQHFTTLFIMITWEKALGNLNNSLEELGKKCSTLTQFYIILFNEQRKNVACVLGGSDVRTTICR